MSARVDMHAADGSYVALMRFMQRYAAALDEGDLDAWAALFAPESSYRVASMENESLRQPLQLIDDRSKSKIEDRIRFIRQFWKGSFNEYVQRHVLSIPGIVGIEDGRVRFEQNLAVYVTDSNFGGPHGGRSSLLCVGRYVGTALLKEEPRLTDLRVILDTSVLSQSIVYPI